MFVCPRLAAVYGGAYYGTTSVAEFVNVGLHVFQWYLSFLIIGGTACPEVTKVSNLSPSPTGFSGSAVVQC